MLAFIAVSLLLIPLALLSHPDWSGLGYHFVVPGIQGGASSDAVLLITAIVGTTVAPLQLFFQQSNVIDKRITPRFIRYERVDTVLGSVVVVLGAAALIVTAAYAATSTGTVGRFTDALGVAHALAAHNVVLGTLFAVAPLDAVWRMLPLALLKPTRWSPATKLGMTALRGYLVLAALLLVVKAIQLGTR
ncbi:divalent metal cation transporter [Amycolatopsis rhizosphaerae]|uniref:divalent metal cation transporter n=1 Tax=Amycolatopsis rhizosphaerae TaxID=2053003 RepID=UPI0024829193|nr:divalent metal cation transporter [Amycolatopsis rhizosphaerae]